MSEIYDAAVEIRGALTDLHNRLDDLAAWQERAAAHLRALAAAARDISDVLHAQYYDGKGWDAGGAEEGLARATQYRVIVADEAARYGPEHT